MEYDIYNPEEEQYIVHHHKEIIQILNDLSKHHEMIKISFNHGNDECITNVISVDTQRHLVYFDIGIDEAFNRRLLASQTIIFSKDHGVRIKWASDHIAAVNLKDGRAMEIALPKQLIRLQRREFFRLATPIVNPVPCAIPISDATNLDVERTLDFTLVDVSLGGIGVIVNGQIDPLLVIGASFDKCKISFPNVGVTSLTLQVKNITEIPVRDGVVKHRIGFQFIAPSRGNEGLINSYTHHLERQAMAMSSKL